MIATLVTLLSSGGFGAVTGLVGSYLGKVEERKQRDLANAHELALRELALREREQERGHELQMADKQMQRAELETELEVDKLEFSAFDKSLDSVSPFGDALRAIARTAILSVSIAAFLWLLFSTHTIIGGLESLPRDELFLLYREMVGNIMFLAMTASFWYFGSRPPQKRL